MSKTKVKVMDIAERMARSGGYNGFSFREIATEIGIKSASVHHHFPTKEILATEVANRYTTRFMDALGEPFPVGSTVFKQIDLYCGVFQKSFEATGRTCLCGMFSNEANLLPDSLREAIGVFVDVNIEWLTRALAGVVEPEVDLGNFERKARSIYAALEGAIGVAALKNDSIWLSDVSEELLQSI